MLGSPASVIERSWANPIVCRFGYGSIMTEIGKSETYHVTLEVVHDTEKFS